MMMYILSIFHPGTIHTVVYLFAAFLFRRNGAIVRPTDFFIILQWFF